MENAAQRANDAGRRELPKDMTVEEYLLAERDRLVADVETHAEGLVRSLREEYAVLKARYVELAKADQGEAAASSPTRLQVELTVLEGLYKGRTFEIAPGLRASALVGRSRGKKFSTAGVGISLFRDKEVSTTHGKFEVSPALDLVYVDVGSTNGTQVNGKPCAPNVKIPLGLGDALRIGTNTLKVTKVEKVAAGPENEAAS